MTDVKPLGNGKAGRVYCHALSRSAPLVLATLASVRVSLPRPVMLALVALAFVSQLAMLVGGHAAQLGYLMR